MFSKRDHRWECQQHPLANGHRELQPVCCYRVCQIPPSEGSHCLHRVPRGFRLQIKHQFCLTNAYGTLEGFKVRVPIARYLLTTCTARNALGRACSLVRAGHQGGSRGHRYQTFRGLPLSLLALLFSREVSSVSLRYSALGAILSVISHPARGQELCPIVTLALSGLTCLNE